MGIIMSEDCLSQIATDYDVELHEVRRIADLFPDNIYQKLEELIET
jgi:hypothetical protein